MALHDPRPLETNPDEGPESKSAEPLSTFGRYLLFKRLRKDALGELYRAGQLGDDAIERVVSLRLFLGPEVDGERFRTSCAGRDGIDALLRGGPYGEVVDAGCEGGVAFVAHEFVCGRSLAELLAQSRERSDPVPLDQALHLLDRISIALQNAYETRLEGKRIRHGFLVPDFVHLSSEGELRLIGFESSDGLLDLSATSSTRSRLAGYISPEVNAGQAPEASDDVYSLGAILAELLTGEPLPALNPAESSRWVEGATLAQEGGPIPEGIRFLLRESLLPRDQRIKNAEQWHKALTEAAAATGETATTFDVAFFMHTLFGAELENEAELVKAEMESEIPPPSLRPVLATALAESTPAVAEESAEREVRNENEVAAPTPPAPMTASKIQSAAEERPHRPWLFVVAAALLLAAGGAAYYLLGPPSRAAETAAPIQVAMAPRVSTAAPPEPVVDDTVAGISEVAPPLSPEELESQVRSLVAQRAGDLEANLKAEYDQRLVELRRQLEEARTANTPAAPTTGTAQPAAEPQRSQPGVRTAEPPKLERAAPAAARQQPAATPPPPADPEPEVAERPQTPPPEPVERPRVETRAEPRPPEPRAAEPEPVEAGSVVTAGPTVAAPTLLRQPNVIYPPAAARLKRRATIKLRVLVDEKGRPSQVEQVSDKVGLGFDSAAARAAQTTRWTPPTKDGVPVKMWVELSIDFRP